MPKPMAAPVPVVPAPAPVEKQTSFLDPMAPAKPDTPAF
jgi:hypothetical protein